MNLEDSVLSKICQSQKDVYDYLCEVSRINLRTQNRLVAARGCGEEKWVVIEFQF